MGNENRGCIGCHEDRELSPPNRLVSAVIEPPVDLVLPPSRRRTVDFRNQIAPIVEANCATSGCHVRGQAEPVLGTLGRRMPEPDLRAVYRSLLEETEGRPGRPYVVPGRARESPLVTMLSGNGTNPRTTASTAHDMLGRRDLILFIEWIDLGAAWEVPPGQAGRGP
jgi:hypothetical protein